MLSDKGKVEGKDGVEEGDGEDEETKELPPFGSVPMLYVEEVSFCTCKLRDIFFDIDSVPLLLPLLLLLLWPLFPLLWPLY